MKLTQPEIDSLRAQSRALRKAVHTGVALTAADRAIKTLLDVLVDAADRESEGVQP
jgi:anaerobic glycerol-3-phosphate dehydrogenase